VSSEIAAGLGSTAKNVPAALEATSSWSVVSVTIRPPPTAASGLMSMFKVADVGLLTVTECTMIPPPLIRRRRSLDEVSELRDDVHVEIALRAPRGLTSVGPGQSSR
jgi:hypothetical protein